MSELNCLNCCIGNFKNELCDCEGEFCTRYKSIGSADDFIDKIMNRPFELPKEVIASYNNPILRKLGEEIWTKTCVIEDHYGLSHEVIHTTDLKIIIREVLKLWI